MLPRRRLRKKLASANPIHSEVIANLTDISFCVNKILLNGIDLVLKGTGQKKQKVLGLLRKRDGDKKLPVFPSILQNTETRYFVL